MRKTILITTFILFINLVCFLSYEVFRAAHTRIGSLHKPDNAVSLTPQDVLYAIYDCDLSRDYSELSDYIYDVKYMYNKKSYSSLSLTKDGIVQRKRFIGAYSYSKKGLLFHAENISKYIKSAEDGFLAINLGAITFNNKNDYLKKIIDYKKDKDYVVYYKYGSTFLAFIRCRTGYKLLMSANMDMIDG